MFKRIISCLVLFSIVFTSVVFPVYADYGDDPGDLIPEYNTPQTGGSAGVGAGPIAPLPPDLGGGFFSGKTFWDILKDTLLIIESVETLLDAWGVKDPLLDASFCPVAAEQTYGLAPWHTWSGSGLVLDDYVCGFCGITYGEMSAKFQELYLGYTSDLSDPSASYVQKITGFTVTNISTSGSPSYISNYSAQWKECLKQAYYSNSAVVVGVYSKYMWGYYWDQTGRLTSGLWTNPLGVTNSGALGVYLLDDLQLLRTENVYTDYVFFNKALAEQSVKFATGTVFAVSWDSENDGVKFKCFRKLSSNTVWDSGLYEYSTSIMTNIHMDYTNLKNVYSATSADCVIWDSAYIMDQPENHTEQSRPSGIMDAIQQYNTTNNYYDNSVVNYYIGSFDENDNLTGYYPMDIYDEQTLVFTEPVTGAQYQTTGWTYDYALRSYLLDLESGTFALGDYDILQIRLTYGDEAVTIEYYNELGELVETDTYQYIMVAQEQCTLNGHSYTVDTTKEATCTSAGERLYSCSVCGDQKVESIAMMEHSCTFSILKEPSCTADGLGLYTCSTCGMQYTEPIPALEHTGVLLEVVDTVYGESGAVISVGYSVYECSTCGTQYVVHDEVGSGGAASGFWGSIVDSFANALASAIDAVLGAIIYILETILGLIRSLLGFLYSFITDTVLGGISDMFAVFTDGSLFEYFQDENGAVGLPSEVGSVFGFYSGMIMALPWEIRSVMFFGIAALILIAIFKLQ